MARLERLSKDAFLVHELLGASECASYIEEAESRGFADAPVTTPMGPMMLPDVRDNERVMYDDVEEAERLWARLEPFVPEAWREFEAQGMGWRACGLNERLRYYRYDPTQSFRMHRDGYFARGIERSHMTVLFYLNEGFEGGETMLMLRGGEHHVVPRVGMVLCFKHRLLHEGVRVERGRKYVLRTDLMYEGS